MNTQRKLGNRILSYILCMALVLSGLMVPTQQVRAEETPEVEIGAIVASGDCGAEGSETSVKWELTKNGEVDGNDTYTITISGTGAMADYNTDVAYPEWNNTEEKRENITKVVIGYGVTRIGNDSFYDCVKVEEVVFEQNEKGESSVTSIGKYAFRNIDELTSIVIPTSVETIGNNAFRSCEKLLNVVFEESSNLTTIGEQAFYGLKKLEECILPSKVTTVKDYAFRVNSDLKHFYYPSIVNDLGTGVFYNVNSLAYLGRYTVNETAKTCSVEYIGLDTTKWLPDDTIVPTASEIIIPEKLDGYEVVQATISDNTVDIPKSFEADHKIAKLSDIEALEGWNYEEETDELPAGGSVDVTLTSYKINDTQKFIITPKTITVSRAACADTNKDHKCDLGCDAAMGDCIDTNIDHKCDYGCDKNIGECVDANKDHKCDYGCDKNIGECVDANNDHKCDYGCDKVTEHTWDAGVITKEPTPQDKGEKTYTCTFCKATKTEEVAALGVPEVGTEDVSDDGKATYKVTKSDLEKGTVTYVAPTDAKATTVTIPATVEIDGVKYSVTAIEKNAFKKNKNLKKVTIGKNVKTIGKSAFEGCKKMTTITIGKSVAKIGEKAFYGCSKVKTLTIKTTKLTTKKIGSKAFAKTPKTMTVKVPKKKFTAYKSMLIKKGVHKKAKFKKA